MNRLALAPKILFFKEVPDKLIEQPPLASSLQSFETSLILISQQRYPHAHVSLASAIESAMKSILRIEKDSKIKAWKLYELTKNKFASLNNYEKDVLDDFREKRNEYIHYGFIPGDDEESARQLLSVGFPFFVSCCNSFFQFDIIQSLHPELSFHFNTMIEMYRDSKTSATKQTAFFISVSHWLNWNNLEQQRSDWEFSSLIKAEELGLKYEKISRCREKLEIKWSNTWDFTCPICGEVETFIGNLDNEKAKMGIVSFDKGYCLNCQFYVSDDIPGFMNRIIATEIKSITPLISKEYGL
jgi:hypothetical protein